MLIKLNLEGELLDKLLKDAERNCRTNPKQIEYYLQEIYNGNILVLNDNQQGTNMVLTKDDKTNNSTDKDFVSTDTDKDSTKSDQHGTNMVPKDIEQLQKEVDNLGDDILNF